jgi:hypothetical protein
MSGQPAVSARALVRGFVLVIGSFVLISGASCGRQTFDLLPLESAGAASGGAPGVAAPSSGAPGVGGGESGGGGGRSPERDAGTPRAGGGNGGSGGNVGSGGSGFPQGGDDQPCLAGEVCTDGGLSCPPNVTSCKRCTVPADCGRDAPPFCDVENGRCVECRTHDTDCPPGETCDSYFLRCAKACQSNSECDDQHPICDPYRHVCVECENKSQCLALRPQENDSCFVGFCVECVDNSGCPSPDKPLCQGLHCVAKQ